MSKKKATNYQLSYIWPGSRYVTIDFLDKKGKTMRSSVDVVLNSEYLIDETNNWDYEKLEAFVRAR